MVFIADLFHWILGFSTVEWEKGTISIRGPWKIYTLLLITYSLVTRIERHLNDKFLYSYDTAPGLIYFSMKNLECLTGIVALLLDTFAYKRIKLKMHENLAQGDAFMGVNRQFSYKKTISWYLFYAVYVISYNLFDWWRWNTKYHQLGVMLKNVMMDMAMMRYIFEMSVVKSRIQLINKRLQDNGIDKKIDFRENGIWFTSSVGEDIVSKHDMEMYMKVYLLMQENADILKKRYSVAMTMYPLTCFFTVILAMNMFALSAKYSETQGISGVISIILWMGRYLFILLLVATATQLLRAEQGRTKIIVGKFIISRKIGFVKTDKLKIFTSLLTNGVGRNAGLLQVDCEYVYNLIGFTTSYAIILIQLDILDI